MKADDTETYKTFGLDSDKWMPLTANHKMMSIDTEVWGAFKSSDEFVATIEHNDGTMEDVAFNKIKPFDTFEVDDLEDGEIDESGGTGGKEDGGKEDDAVDDASDSADLAKPVSH